MWQLTRTADAEDPRWQGRPGPRRIVAAAHTPGEARMLAVRALAAADRDRLANETGPPENAAGDEKLYRVDRLGSADEVAGEGPAVLAIER